MPLQSLLRHLVFLLPLVWLSAEEPATSPFSIDLTVARQGFDREFCWVHARAGVIPGLGTSENPLAVMTLQRLQLSGSDVFFALNEMRSADDGLSWTEPIEHPSFARVPFSFLGQDDLEVTVCDFWPKWHGPSRTLLGTGHTVVYENNRVKAVRPRGTVYAVYDPEAHSWSPWKTIKVLVPERGARLGNFGVTKISEDETWVTVTEWMQGPGPNPSDPEPLIARGADNRIWVAKLKWAD